MTKHQAARFFEDRRRYLEAGNIDGLVTAQYSPDATLASLSGKVVHGRAAIAAALRSYVASAGASLRDWSG